MRNAVSPRLARITSVKHESAKTGRPIPWPDPMIVIRMRVAGMRINASPVADKSIIPSPVVGAPIITYRVADPSVISNGG